MKLSWFQYWLQRAVRCRSSGKNYESVTCLNKAEQYTSDPTELQYLDEVRRHWKVGKVVA